MTEEQPKTKAANSLFAVTPNKSHLSKEQIAEAFTPDRVDDEEAQPKKKRVAEEATTGIRPTNLKQLDLPARPAVRRKRHKDKEFKDIYVTRSFSIDKRIVKYVDEYLGQGDTITSFVNPLLLKILLDVGYDIDPDILNKP